MLEIVIISNQISEMLMYQVLELYTAKTVLYILEKLFSGILYSDVREIREENIYISTEYLSSNY